MTETLSATAARNFVGGEWRESASGATYEKHNPWRPSEVTGVFAASSADDAQRRGRGRRATAFPAWAGPARARARRVLLQGGRRDRGARRADRAGHDRRDGQAAARGADGGRARPPRSCATRPARPSGRRARCTSRRSRNQTLYTRRRPLGVVGLITPWNFPVAIPVWKLAPALIYGNTVVLKLGYEAPRTGLHIAECFAEAGLPAGVLNVLTGAGSKVGAELVSNRARARALVHRLGRGRPRGAERGDGAQLPRPARARRPQPASS